MNYCHHIIGFVFLLFYISAFPQTKNIEKSVIECRYRLVMLKDTIHKLNPVVDDMVLRVGETKSQFFSRYTFYHDSLWADPNGRALAEELTLEAFRTRDHSKRPSHRTTTDYIYKNYSEGKITTRSLDFHVGLEYEEDIEVPNWDIQEHEREILTYNCQKAACAFRGRQWIAWYAPDIPIGEGPWKLCGLPGLILEVHDANDDYHFTVTSIDQNPSDSVCLFIFDEEPYLKTDRKTHLWAYKRFLTGTPAEEIELIRDVIWKSRKKNYLAREKRILLYDFLERDYILP